MSSSRRIDLPTWIAFLAHHEEKLIEDIENGRGIPLPSVIADLDASRHHLLKAVRLSYVNRCVNLAMLILIRLTRDDSWNEGVDDVVAETSSIDCNSLKAEDIVVHNIEVEIPCPPRMTELASGQEVLHIRFSNDGCTMNGVMLDTSQRQTIFDCCASVEFISPFRNVPLVKRQFTQSRHQFLQQLGLLFRMLFSRAKCFGTSNAKSSNRYMNGNGSTTDEKDQTDNASKLMKRMTVDDLDRELLYAGVPASICRFVSDLIHSNSSKDDEGTSFQSLGNILIELREIIDDRPQQLFYEEHDSDEASASAEDRGIDFGNVLTGRTHETCQLLQMAALPVQLFKNRLVLIGGARGVGKSYLVDTVKNMLVADSGWVHIAVKFDRRMQNSPLSAIASGFQSFFASLVSAGNQELYVAAIRSSLNLTLSPSMIALLCNLIPSLGRLFPALMERVISDDDLPSLADRVDEDLNSYRRHEEIPSDPESTRNRLYYSFRKLVHAISSLGRPLLFALDDLHWAGEASLELIKSLMTEIDPMMVQQDRENAQAAVANVLFVGLYRTEEVDEEHILSMKYFPEFDDAAALDVLSIQLHPFTKEACNAMISRALGLPVRLTRRLADIVHAKTLGNPFYIKVFVESLVLNKTLHYSLSEKRWLWDIDNLAAAPISESVAQLLTKNLQTLPDTTIWALKLLSCLGSRAEESTLELLEDHIDMAEALEVAITSSIVLKNGRVYNFAHDILEETVYDLMEQSQQHSYHYFVGKEIIYKTLGLGSAHEQVTQFGAVMFIAIDQINRAFTLGDWQPKYSMRYATFNLKAAESSMILSDFASALSYAEHGISFLTDRQWEEPNYKLSLHLREIASKACVASSQYDKLHHYFEDIFEHTAHCLEDRLPTHLLLIEALGLAGEIDEATDSAFSVLAQLGEALPRDISSSLISDEVMSTKIALGGIALDINNAPRLKKWNISARISVFCSMLHFLLHSKPHYVAFMACRIVKLSIEHGFCSNSAFGLAPLANHLLAIDMDAAYQCGQLGLSLFNSFESNDKRPRLKCYLYLTVKFFHEPLQSVADVLRNNSKDAILAGDTYNSCTSLLTFARCSIMCGHNLCDLNKECEMLVVKFKQPDNRLRYFGTCLLIYQLSDRRTFPSSLMPDLQLKSEEELLERLVKLGNPLDLQNGYFNLLVLDFWFANYDKAADWAQKYRDCSKGQAGSFTRIVDVFYSYYEGLTAFQMARKSPQNNMWIEMGERSMAFFENLCKYSVWNWEGKYLILKSELEVLRGNSVGAIKNYQASIKSANEHRFVHEEGLAFELLSSLYTDHGDLDQAKLQLTRARECYEKWGALAVIDVRAPAKRCLPEESDLP